MDPAQLQTAREAVRRLPSAAYLMAARFDHKRAGLIVRSIQPVADEPMMLAVAVRKGHPIEPIIRDAHCFSVGLVDPHDKLILKKFGNGEAPGDAFDCLPTETAVSGAPLIKRCLVAFDCAVSRHLDMEADHELYIGQVLAARVYAKSEAKLTRPA